MNPALLPAIFLALTLLSTGCVQPAGREDDRRPGPTPLEAILLAEPYPDLLVEIDYVEPFVPAPIAVDALRGYLEDLTEKKTITILPFEEIPAQGGPYDDEDYARLVDEFVDSHGAPEVLQGRASFLHVFLLDGRPQNQSIGGFSSHRMGIFLFPELYDDVPVPAGPVGVTGSYQFLAEAERSILVHELGHSLGLVNHGVPMVRPRESREHPQHSTNPASVMNYSAHYLPTQDQGDWASDHVASFKWHFDEYDVEDIRAFQAAHAKKAQAAGASAEGATDLPSIRSVMTRTISSRIT